jgi:DNA-binding winged helix-turn-helix (wHTH) protein
MRLRFGPWELDSEQRLLRGDGQVVHVSPKAFDLLCVLAEARPRAVDKQTLSQQVWRDTFVSDGSLAVLVAELRAALKDSARQPSVLRTVPRYGYAFCADATDATPASPSPAAAAWLLNRSQRIPIGSGVTIVGRDPGCAAMIDAQSVSRRHARLTATPDGLSVEDLDSKNGTFVNDRQIDGPTPVADDDRVRFGTVQFVVRAASSETATRG